MERPPQQVHPAECRKVPAHRSARLAHPSRTAGFFAALAGACLLMPGLTGGVHGDVPEKVLTYAVHHPTHGKIGTYTNIIRDTGAEVSVRNEFRVQVKVLLVVAYKETGSSKEIWKNGRLVSFESKTQENGKNIGVNGRATGEKFVIETPNGPREAPADVYPNNPWSMNILKASVLLGTKSGSLYNVSVSEGVKKDLKFAGQTVSTDYFLVDGDAKYELWFDKAGIPLKFTEIGDNGVITFKLAEKQPSDSTPVIKGSILGQ
jgi:uncharacterized protein DUF6134